MKEALAGLFWFGVPTGGRRSEHMHAPKWQGWAERAASDQAARPDTLPLYRAIFRALRSELLWALLAVTVHGATAYGAAIAVQSMLTRLLSPGSSLRDIVVPGTVCLVLTYIAWLALNHTFFLAELVGVGARSYTEHRLLLARPADQRQGLTVLFDREASRVQSTWSSLVVLTLACVTVVFVSAFFLLALGLSAAASLFVIFLSSFVVYQLAKRVDATHTQLSAGSARRVAVGAFAINNRLQVWLRNWDPDLVRRYAASRAPEETALKRAARLVAVVSLVSTLTPLTALLSAVGLQLAFLGHVDVPSVLAAVALMGSLRSVANGIPDIVQNIARGVVGHRMVARHLAMDSVVDDPIGPATPPLAARHIAIIGAAGTGKTTVLQAVARSSAPTDGPVLYVPDEPWIVPGGLRKNLSLFRKDPGDDEVASALAMARLPGRFHDEYVAAGSIESENGWNVSRGQGKRLELARALLGRPALVLIDQPTSGVDDGLAQGLLADLLAGPWRDTTVVYVTARQEEQDAADEVWLVDGGVVSNVRRNSAKLQNGYHHVSERGEPDLFAAANTPTEVQASAAPSPASGKSTLRSLHRFGVLGVIVLVFGLFTCRETLTIAGDYIMTSGALVADFRSAALWLAIAALGGAALSISGALLIVRRTIGAASAHCVNYFATLVNQRQGRTDDSADQDSHGRLIWDQRRVDEVLPGLLLESLGATTLLAVTIGYIVVTNVLIVVPLAVVGTLYWRSSRRSGGTLHDFNKSEVDMSAWLVTQVEALSHDGGRFAVLPDRRAVLDWLSADMALRAFASLDNAAARRWYSYKLDLIGVTFLGAVLGSAVYGHVVGGIGPAEVLALSLSYSLIAIFGRLGRCLVELRQVLDSADRVALPLVHADADPKHRAPGGRPLVMFNDVTFVNSRNGVAILEQFTESFSAGDIVVITGESGIGKSTFAHLVVGNLSPTNGKVDTLGVTTGYVSSPHGHEIQLLTSKPVFKPELLADHFAGANPIELTALAKRLGVHRVVESLPLGFNETVGADGTLALSKSQLQALALLDIAVNRPAIAILDEAASELAADDEVTLVTTLISMVPQTLFFIITHNTRLSALATRQFHFTDRRQLVAI